MHAQRWKHRYVPVANRRCVYHKDSASPRPLAECYTQTRDSTAGSVVSGYSSRPTALPGLNDGVGLGFCDGTTVGVALGRPVGLRVTRMVGNRVGSGVGTKLVGSSVGVQLGYSVGAIVGVSVEYLNATQLSDQQNRSSHSPTPTRQCTHTCRTQCGCVRGIGRW